MREREREKELEGIGAGWQMSGVGWQGGYLPGTGFVLEIPGKIPERVC